MTVNQENVNKFWSTMNDVLCKNNNKSDISAIKDPDTNLLLNPTDSVEVLNHYFVNVAAALVDKLPEVPNIPRAFTNIDSSLKLDVYVSPGKIKSVLKELSLTKSSGCLRISSIIYLYFFEVLHEQLAFIMNLSLRFKTFPDAWKKIYCYPDPQKMGLMCCGEH